ncbi:ABC transporter permease [Paenactinomyces guangxiensis]|uniref:ABC transporter permease n=1 Tax=Paenactinomyces guangxiensis TaxID=1490290 RepID=A0A7W2A7Q8_9BACL|nr:ABC transporter permease [Paenactinomyces guangxiensis]MBA4493038.1 ABC transporter permease [Paenactinomyces guangxiensis]MBH8590113.1 ABC transporter permease [Paenactinomyces guangxiensis]
MNAKTNVSKATVQGPKRNKLKSLFQFREASILSIIVILFILLSLTTPGFLTAENLKTTMIGLALDGIVAVGTTLVLVAAGVDLSVGSVLALSGVLAGYLAYNGVNIWVASVVAIVVSLFTGFLNGFFISRIGLNPLIMTLGMMSIARGIAYVITEGAPVSVTGIDPAFLFLGQGDILGIPMLVIILFVVVLLGDILLRKSTYLRQVYYVGSNEKAARLSGINVKNIHLIIYIVGAVLAGIAGLLALARFSVATPTSGVGTELRVISACVIGGASLTGGVGTIMGTLLGVILVGLVNNALVLLDVSVYWQSLVTGLVLIVAVTLDVFNNRRKLKKQAS